MNPVTRDLGRVQAIIALILIAAGIAVFGALLFVPVPQANAHQFDLVLGNLEGAFVTAVAYYLGSSRAPASKDAAFAQPSAAPVAAPAPQAAASSAEPTPPPAKDG